MSKDVREYNKHFGNIDLFLLDLVLKGWFEPSMTILDAGCGEGRNLTWFIREGFDVYGVDRSEGSIRMLHYVARSLKRDIDTSRFQIGNIENLPYRDHRFDVVICNAVLHFAESEAHFFQMTDELVRVLASGGLLFIQMTSDIGRDARLKYAKEGKSCMPDGSVRFVLTRDRIKKMIKKYALKLMQPVKTVIEEEGQVLHAQSPAHRECRCSSVLLFELADS